MAILFASAITSFVICFLVIPVIIKYSLEKNIVDIPGRRKIHKKVTPSMGGIAIFIGFIISYFIWLDIPEIKDYRFIPMALSIVFFIGLRDDIVPLQPLMKIIGQIISASLLIFLFDLRLKSFYGFMGVYDIPFSVSVIITMFTIIVITNSFNLIDGLDGLAGMICSISLIAFGVYFYLMNEHVYALLSFSLIGAMVAFLIFNWEPSKIFMGDTGALVLGMMLSILAIHFIDFNYHVPVQHHLKMNSGISLVLCFIIIPLADTLRIFIIRILRKQSPFTPDKGHIHHNFVRLGLSHSSTTILLGFIQLLFIGLALSLQRLNDNYILLIIFLICLALSLFLDKLVQRKVARHEE